jgi:hypothetical protein
MEGSMRVFGLLLSLLSLPLFAATELTTQIHDIDYGKNPDDEVLVFLTSGHVAKLRDTKGFMPLNMKSAKTKSKWFNVSMDDDRFITDIRPTAAPVPDLKPGMSSKFEKGLNATYVPTTIESMEVAKKYFREARYNPKDSQCFNRAMIWTYEWWKNHSVKSNKLLIYFTRNYIRRYNFEWWFHIAPYVHVMENGKVVERVMDRKYSRGPLEFTKWTNTFMKNDAPCPVITKFSDYADYPYSGECFIQRTHMYTYQPADLQMYEAWGYSKENFNMNEVRGAYLEAFDEQI